MEYPKSMMVIQLALRSLNVLVAVMAGILVVVLSLHNNWGVSIFIAACALIFVAGYARYAKDRGKKLIFQMSIWTGYGPYYLTLLAGGIVVYAFINLLLGKL